MKIIKVLTNNVVYAWDGDNREVVLMGCGIGFNRSLGGEVDERKIEKKFFIQDSISKKYELLLKRTDMVYFELAEDIKKIAEKKMKGVLGDYLIFSLADHLSFAVMRYKNKDPMPNLLLKEVKLLYPEEYEIGEVGRQMINRRLNVNISEDEAGYIALHIVNATISRESYNANDILAFVTDVAEIVRRNYGDKIEANDYQYTRFMSHLKFLARRVFNEELISISVVSDVKPYIIQRDGLLKTTLDEIKAYIKNTYEYSLSETEEVYIMIYILRITKQ